MVTLPYKTVGSKGVKDDEKAKEGGVSGEKREGGDAVEGVGVNGDGKNSTIEPLSLSLSIKTLICPKCHICLLNNLWNEHTSLFRTL